MKRIISNEKDNFQWKCQRYFHFVSISRKMVIFDETGRVPGFFGSSSKTTKEMEFQLLRISNWTFSSFWQQKTKWLPILISSCNHHHHHCPPYMAARDHKAKQGPDSWCEASRSLTFSSSFALQTIGIGIGIIMSVIADLLPHLYH